MLGLRCRNMERCSSSLMHTLPSWLILPFRHGNDLDLQPVPRRIVLVAGLRHDCIVRPVSGRIVLYFGYRNDHIVHCVPSRHVLHCGRRRLHDKRLQRRVRRGLILGEWRLLAVRHNHDRSGAVQSLQCGNVCSAIGDELQPLPGRFLLPLWGRHDFIVHSVPGRNVLHLGRCGLSVERLRRRVCSGLLFHPRRLCRCRRHERSGAVHALRCGHVRDPVVRELLGVPDRYVLESGHWHNLGLHGLPSRNVLHYRCRGLRFERLRRPMH